jgi:hypothetical protein
MRRISLWLPAALLIPLSAFGQQGATPAPADNVGDTVRPVIHAVRLLAPLRLDGLLDEPLYRDHPPVTGFIQTEPLEGQPATERTDVWVSFDTDSVYVTFRCWESEPARLVANEMRRDSGVIWQGNDLVGFIFDTFLDRRNSILFTVNAIGGRQDGQVTEERQWNGDWNPVWDVATSRFPGGWTVEAALPFKSLRYRPGEQQVWGFNALRINRWKNEISLISPGPSGQGQQGLQYASMAATLTGIEAPAEGAHIDIKPYAAADYRMDRGSSSSRAGADAGLDVKVAVTQNVAADLTINTDFAQVEADEQQVNLTRFSLFFPEKREFFLENRGLFAFGGVSSGGDATPVLFYSRRIGLDEGQIVPIRAGGRVTGRAGRYSFGVLNMITGEHEGTASPRTNFTVARVKRDILRRSSVGLLVTERSAGAPGGGRNLAYGVDGGFGFFANLNVNAYWARTRSDGLDGHDTSYRAQLDYDGDRYGAQLERLRVGEHFRPEVGFVRRGDIRRTTGQLRFSPRPARIEAIRKLSWSGAVDYLENGVGLVESREQEAAFGIDFENGDAFSLSYTRSYEFLPETFEISSGIELPVGDYDYQSLRAGYSIGQRRRASAQLSVEHGSFYSGRKTSVGISRGRVNVSPQLSVEPTYTVNRVALDEGSFTSHLASARVTYTMTPMMFASALVQYRSDGRIASANARLRWEYRPGSELFVVYDEERDSLGGRFPQLANRAVIVKVNRLLRF